MTKFFVILFFKTSVLGLPVAVVRNGSRSQLRVCSV